MNSILDSRGTMSVQNCRSCHAPMSIATHEYVKTYSRSVAESSHCVGDLLLTFMYHRLQDDCA